MNFEKVVFGFFIVLALTLNFGFFVGDIDNPDHHHAVELGDRSQMGAVLLATSLVADLQLLIAAFVWAYAAHISEAGMTSEILASIVSLSGGALLANLVSVTLLVAETISIRR